jgi:hypothetical protein
VGAEEGIDMKLCSKIVAAISASDPGNIIHVGECFGYLDEPSYLISTPAGQVSWAASITREATTEEQIAYWRDRAFRAEGNAR